MRKLGAALLAVTVVLALAVFVGVTPGAPAEAAGSPRVDFGPLTHAGLRKVGAPAASTPITLQFGLVANLTGIQQAVGAASDPTSKQYGQYPTLTELASTYGAPARTQSAVLSALGSVGVKGRVDVTGLRVTAPMTIGQARLLLSTTWSVYATGVPGQRVAVPDRRPTLPATLAGYVDVVAGLRPFVFVRASRSTQSRTRPTTATATPSRARRAAGGTPTRTGSVGKTCLGQADPAALAAPVGLYPNQILDAYGVAPLHRLGLRGEGIRLAILGEAPTRLADVRLFRECFGAPGTPLRIHGGAGIPPILESSLDAMVVSMVAPRLTGFDLWVRPLRDTTNDGDVEGFLRLLTAPLEAARSGTPLPDVVSVSYGICEAIVAPFTSARALVERALVSYAALGITVVVAAGDSGSSTCARGIPSKLLTAAFKHPFASWPASSPWVLAVGGTNLTLKSDNSIASTGVWNDTAFRRPYQAAAAGSGGPSMINRRPWWQPAKSFVNPRRRLVPDVAAFADAFPGYAVICSGGVQGCRSARRPGRTVAFVGGTSASAPLVAGMIALWDQRARELGLKRPGFVPPFLYFVASKHPEAFVDIRLGSNAIYKVPCCAARPGYDLASGLGSPLADRIASLQIR
jgi:subtilase family serine protease